MTFTRPVDGGVRATNGRPYGRDVTLSKGYRFFANVPTLSMSFRVRNIVTDVYPLRWQRGHAPGLRKQFIIPTYPPISNNVYNHPLVLCPKMRYNTGKTTYWEGSTMPLHDEEMDRRRQRREAQRRKQRAEVRRLKITLALAVIVLVLCGVGLAYLTRNNRQEPSVQATQVTTAPTQAPTKPKEKPTKTVLHIKAAGDLNVTNAVVESGIAVNGYDYTKAFMDVAAILSDADLTLLNFEGNICGEPYGSATTSAPRELLDGLRHAGVDMLQMANSCAVNNGLIGLTSTLQAIRNAGLEPVGAFASQAERDKSKGYTMVEIQGVKIAFVAFTKGLGGRGMPAGNESLVNLLYTDYYDTYDKLDRDGITAILKDVEAEKPDLTIALVHWGSEYNETVSSTQESIVSLLKKRGVDVILGTHPHLVQEIDYNEGNGSLVAYSLGDFFGDAERGGTNYSIILDLEITKDLNTNKTRVTDYSYTPIYTLKDTECEGNTTIYRVMRIDTALSSYHGNFLDKITKTTQESMTYALQRIDERTNPPEPTESK